MITGQIKKIICQNPNDWGVYRLVMADKSEISAVGIIPEPSIGMRVTLDGYEKDNDHGHQFMITSVLATEADIYAGARRFLTDGYMNGIGLVKANAMLEKFGNEVLDMFETEEGRKKIATVKGIKEATIEKILPKYEENKKYKDIVVFLGGTGTKKQVEHIYEKYGDNAVNVLKKNPYRLQMDLDGFGFARADAIALASGIKTNSVYRVMAAIKYSLETAASQKGHCYLTIDEIKESVQTLLVPTPKCSDLHEKTVLNALSDWNEKKEGLIEKHDPNAETIEKLATTWTLRQGILDVMTEALSMAVEEGEFVNDDGRIYTKKMYELESKTAQMIAQMCEANPVRFVAPGVVERAIREVEQRKTEGFKASGRDIEFRITKEQKNAVYTALMNRISIISGGPGRGKTAISEIVAHGFLLSGPVYDKNDIIMLAPTGRAAQRITESTGYSAMTVHRAIISNKKGQSPKDKLILVDESSMADISLTNSILSFAKDCNLIFVGDVDQIASIGPGKVLKDMIDSECIPCVLLKEGHRNSGTIAHNSTLINAGVQIDKYCYDEHFVYIPSTIDKLLDTIVADYKKKVTQYGITEVMLCAAMRERGPVSVNKLNQRLQDEYTRGRFEARIGGKIFRVGDRVMQTKNDYEFSIYRQNELVEGVFNGERGTIMDIKYVPDEDDYKIIVKFDDGSFGGYRKGSAQNLTLAYATTLHKCQGSEAQCMMMTYVLGDYVLLNRALFYTGETRAKKEFRFYGEEKWDDECGYLKIAFNMAVKSNDDIKRNTSLSEKIQAAVNA